MPKSSSIYENRDLHCEGKVCFLQKQLVLRPEPANPVSPLPPYFFSFRSFVQNKMPLCQIKMNDLVVYIHVNCSFTKLKPELGN